MKAITLYQPWATLVACGHKCVETRAWSTDYRGELAIHAAKSTPAKLLTRALFDAMARVLGIQPLEAWHRYDEMPRGRVVAVSSLVDVVPVGKMVVSSPAEAAFGDYSPGRFCWLLGDVRPVVPTVPCRGAQRIWTLGAEDAQLVRAYTVA